MPNELYSTPLAMNVVFSPFHMYRFSFPASAPSTTVWPASFVNSLVLDASTPLATK